MAYRNSLFLIAFFLVATSSVANCQTIKANTAGIVRCTIGVSIRTRVAVSLFCNRIPVAPAVTTTLSGVFLISIGLPNATLVNAANCTVVVTNAPTAIGGCPVINSSQVLQAPIINLAGAGSLPRRIELFRAGTFSPVDRSVAINATISA